MEVVVTNRSVLVLAGAGLLVLAACSKKPEPEVVPTPTQTTTPPPPTPAPPPPPAAAEATCEQVITSMVTELAALVHFDTDRFEIRPGDAQVLDRKAVILASHPEVRVRITGHADERYTAEYNLVLGSRRSQAAADYLAGKGVPAGRMDTATLGETAPLDVGHTEDAWARNRRAEVEVIAGRQTLASHLARCR